MEGKGRFVIVGAAVIALLMGAFFLGRAVGTKEGVIQDQVEAIKSGHAKYVIVDEFGHTEFHWYDKGDLDLKKDDSKKDEAKKSDEKKDKP